MKQLFLYSFCYFLISGRKICGKLALLFRFVITEFKLIEIEQEHKLKIMTDATIRS